MLLKVFVHSVLAVSYGSCDALSVSVGNDATTPFEGETDVQTQIVLDI